MSSLGSTWDQVEINFPVGKQKLNPPSSTNSRVKNVQFLMFIRLQLYHAYWYFIILPNIAIQIMIPHLLAKMCVFFKKSPAELIFNIICQYFSVKVQFWKFVRTTEKLPGFGFLTKTRISCVQKLLLLPLVYKEKSHIFIIILTTVVRGAYGVHLQRF
jgi:hypothetical protein